MAVVKMRDLMRRPKRVFAQLEETGEPVLVTRNGDAIAALFPVNPQEAAETALAALPEFAESRRRAEHARREGRTRSAADVARDLAARQGEMEARGAIVPTEGGLEPVESFPQPPEALVGAITELFGSNLGRELAPQVAALIADASEPVVHAAATAEPSTPQAGEGGGDHHQETTQRIHQLTGELCRSLLVVTVKSKVVDLLTTRMIVAAEEQGSESEPGGVLGKQLAEETLADITTRVRSVNSVLANRLTGNFSLPLYEAFIEGAEAIEESGRSSA